MDKQRKFRIKKRKKKRIKRRIFLLSIHAIINISIWSIFGFDFWNNTILLFIIITIFISSLIGIIYLDYYLDKKMLEKERKQRAYKFR